MPGDTVERLRRIPLFTGLDEAGLQLIARLGTEFDVPKGSVFIEAGQAGTGLFLIEEGTARVDLSNGKHVELSDGDFFGEVAVITDIPRTARVSATTDLSGFAIRRSDLMRLLESEPSVTVAMLQEVARRLGDLLGQHT